MSTLRIAVDSGDAVRGARDHAPDAERVTAHARADAALAKIEELRRAGGGLSFGAGLDVPFGAGLGGAFTAAELGIKSASAAAQQFGVSLEAIGTVAPASFGRAEASVRELAAATLGAEARMTELFGLMRSAPSFDFATLQDGGTTIDPRGLAMIEAQERALTGVRAGFSGAADRAAAYGTTVERALGTGSIASHVRSILSIGAAFAGIQGVRGAVSAFADFESGLVEVGQSTGLAGDQLDQLGRRVVALSTQVAIPTSELLELAAAAGRLQIKSPEGIEQFVRDAANLRASIPGLGGSIDEFANKIGRLSTLSGESPANISKIGDAIARLDDQFAATGGEILDTSLQVARAGSGFLQSSADALAFGTALASLGSVQPAWTAPGAATPASAAHSASTTARRYCVMFPLRVVARGRRRALPRHPPGRTLDPHRR